MPIPVPVSSRTGPLSVIQPAGATRPLPVTGSASSPPRQAAPVTNGSTSAAPSAAPPASAQATPPPATAPPGGGPAPTTSSSSGGGGVVPIPPVQPLAPVVINPPHLDTQPSALTLWLAFSTIAAVAIVFGARLLFRSR